MKHIYGIALLVLIGIAHAGLVEDGFGYKSKPREQQEQSKDLSTYQKWIGFKSRVEKKVRVFLGVDKTEQIIKARIEKQEQEKKAFEAQKQELVGQLPSFKQVDKGTSAKEYEAISADLKVKNLLPESQAAIPADPKLPKTKSGVATFSLEETKLNSKNQKITVRVSKIPQLNIGQEQIVSAADWALPELRATLARRQEIATLSSPEMVSSVQFLSWLDVTLSEVKYEPIKIVTLKSLGLTEKSINDLKWYTRLETEIKLLAMDRLSVDEYTLLKGLMLELGKNCHAASGIFYSLSGSENVVVDKTAKYNLALCSHKMGLFHQSIPRLLAVVSSEFNKDAKAQAIEILLKDVPYEHEVEVGERINRKDIYELIPKDLKETFHYVVMKSHVRQSKYRETINEATKISESSKYYTKAQYAAAVAEYALGDLRGSLQRQKNLKVFMKTKGISDKNIASLVNINLARFAFQQKQLDLSIANYREIDRSHPLWIDTLQEQGWAQLQNGDEPGAIGNMHSLHSPYFKGVFMPVTFSIRSIGYLNLCHYGDAYRSLMSLEQTYGPWNQSISKYVKSASNTKTYATVYSYLKQRQKEVDGLPESVIREVARKKDFLNIQEHINAIVDETDQVSFLEGLVAKDKAKASAVKDKSKQSIRDLETKVKSADTKPELKQYHALWSEQLSEQKDRLSAAEFKEIVFAESQLGFKKYRQVSVDKLNGLANDLKAKAGGKLKQHLVNLEKDLKELFRNNEFLRYEVFAGSGQNIRFQAAGGKAEEKRLPSSAIPQGKDFKWSFDGEFWEDEVGYYRSNLKSNCPER